jgi:hypothetical protein
MHPILRGELNKARIGDLHREAERDRLARGFGQARRMPRQHGNNPANGRPATVLAHRLLIIMGARSA